MKKIFMMVTAFGMMAVTAQGQACDTLRGNLTSMTLTPSTNYVLEGVVVVPDGEILTIRPGVTICALPDAGLVIDKGGTIEAIGKADSLITFTSVKAPHLRAPGDWVGILIQGDAPNNIGNITVTRGCDNFIGGGSTSNDYGGTLRYVNIEYAGKEDICNTPSGNLVLNSVGAATVIDHVQILESATVGIKLLGGTVPMSDVYIQNCHREDMYITFGYQATISNLLAIKNPAMKTAGYFNNTKAIYVENTDNPLTATNTPLTNPTIDAFTLIGPQQCEELTGDVSTGIYFDKNGGGTFKNGVLSGFNMGILIEDDATANRAASASLKMEYISINQPSGKEADFLGTTWSCEANIIEWLEVTFGICNSTNNNQLNNVILDYNNSICGDYCSSVPLFQIGVSNNLQNREASPLKVGVLQEDPVFTWVQTCPTATCCESNPQARILPLEAYPNPVQHTVTMVVPEVQDQQVKVQVIELNTGRIFYQQVQANEAQLTVDMSTLPKGNYKLRIVTEQATYQATINKD